MKANDIADPLFHCHHLQTPLHLEYKEVSAAAEGIREKLLNRARAQKLVV
jgi:hypothetical protein